MSLLSQQRDLAQRLANAELEMQLQRAFFENTLVWTIESISSRHSFGRYSMIFEAAILWICTINVVVIGMEFRVPMFAAVRKTILDLIEKEILHQLTELYSNETNPR